MNIFRACKQI
jgi:hypothetical protein